MISIKRKYIVFDTIPYGFPGYPKVVNLNSLDI